jgi:hypothetical protein
MSLAPEAGWVTIAKGRICGGGIIGENLPALKEFGEGRGWLGIEPWRRSVFNRF